MATLRLLFKRPGYALACIAILALGIGANSAIFTVIYSVILNPLPFPDSDRLVFVYAKYPFFGEEFGDRMPARRTNYEEWRKQPSLFETVAAFHEKQLNDSRPGTAPVSTLFASPELFGLLGARPQLGRLYSAEDDRPGAEPVAVLTDSYYETRFQRNPAALGQRIPLGGANYTIVGVLPRGFHMPTYGGESQPNPRVWLPLSRLWSKPQDELMLYLTVAAKLQPGVTVDRTRTELGAVTKRLFAQDPQRYGNQEISVFSFAEENSSLEVNQTLYLLLGAVGFVLLIGCANLANLTLARASARSREIAVRLALGSPRGTIIVQLLKESFIVSLLGAAAGLLLAQWAVQAILALEPSGLNRPDQISVNLPVFAFAVLVSVLTALLFGLAPAIAASRTSVNMALKSGGGGGSSAARSRSRQLLIVAEVAMAMMLLTGAGLTLRSFANVVDRGIGLDISRFVSAEVALPEDRYKDAPSRERFFEQWIERARAIPGVEEVTAADALPLHKIGASNFDIEGRPRPDPNSMITSDNASVSPEYFRTMRVPVLAGRDFTPADLNRDSKKGNGVVIVNQAFATQFFPGESPVGKRLVSDPGPGDAKAKAKTKEPVQIWEIVGVAGNYRAAGAEGDERPQRFYPSRSYSEGLLIVRSAVNDPASLAAPMRAALAAVDPQIVATEVETLQHYFDGWMTDRRFTTLLLSIFAGFALILAMTGVYSVMANLVASRTREIGIRMALGAAPGGIGKMVLGDSLRPVAIGVAAGLAGSLALGRVVGSKLDLFGVEPYDPWTLGLAVVAILLIAPVAVWIPLRRATRVSCTVALREE